MNPREFGNLGGLVESHVRWKRAGY